MKIEISQGSPEWVDLRRSKIGASDIPVITGTSPWGSIEKLAHQKRTGTNGFVSKAMQHGTDSEATVIALVASEIKQELIRSPVYVSDEHPFAMASLDAINVEGDLIVEAKAPSYKVHAEYKQSGIPLYYYQQMQWQMICEGNSKKGLFASWYYGPECPNGDLYLEEVEYDQEVCLELLKAGKDFFDRYIAGTEEPLKEKRVEVLAEDAYIQEQLEYCRIQELKKALEAEYAEKLKPIEEKEKPLKELFTSLAQEFDVMASKLKVTIIERKGGIDEKKLESSGIDVNRFRKRPTVYRTITMI